MPSLTFDQYRRLPRPQQRAMDDYALRHFGPDVVDLSLDETTHTLTALCYVRNAQGHRYLVPGADRAATETRTCPALAPWPLPLAASPTSPAPAPPTP